MRACRKGDERGQATIEAALTIPVMFLLMLMLIQPGIILYDRIVMGNAAAEACRLLATRTDAFGSMDGGCEAFVRHRLAAVPPHDCFHVHDGGCTWDIALAGDETSQTVSVTIGNELKPLPLLDMASTLLGMTNAAGNLEIRETVEMEVQPEWAGSSELGLAPSSWIGAWSS